jgi:deazaflavin-dependent oxidoreductase (nitroreductase family)
VTTIELKTRGARSGSERRVTLYAADDEGVMVVIGSWGGRPRHPSWVHNLRASPRAAVKRGKSTYEVTAREVEGAERERLWDLLVAGFPTYARYQQKSERRFAIFRLEPVAPTELSD